MEQAVSSATKRNWRRLHVTDFRDKLRSRANKTLSMKRWVPFEYLFDQNHLTMLDRIVRYMETRVTNTQAAFYSLCINLLRRNGLLNRFQARTSGASEFVKEYGALPADEWLLSCDLPADEYDFLGAIYQTLCVEGERNRKGLYYTPSNIVKKMLGGLDFSGGQTLLDPCCGSGSFLVNVRTDHPERLYGIDIDPVAVMLAKTNMMIRYASMDFIPAIFQLDFLDSLSESGLSVFLKSVCARFDYIVTLSLIHI